MINKKKELIIEKYQQIIRMEQRVAAETELVHRRELAQNTIACCEEFIQDIAKL